jgi:uncharacterized SAM-binding protein YcdF (DUF218 family)
VTFGLRKLAAELVLSGAWVFTLVALGIVLHAWPGGRGRRWARRAWVAAFLLLYLLSTQPVSQAFLLPLERRYPPPSEARFRQGQATVVLSGGFGGSPFGGPPAALSRVSIARTAAAVRYHRQAGTRLLLISGGSGDPLAPDLRESVAMQALAVELGVRPDEILTEAESRSSRESARAAGALLRARGIERVLLVTSAFHLPRSVRLFRREGLDVIPCPAEYQSRPPRWELRSFVPVLGRLSHVDTAVHEYVGLLADGLGG